MEVARTTHSWAAERSQQNQEHLGGTFIDVSVGSNKSTYCFHNFRRNLPPKTMAPQKRSALRFCGSLSLSRTIDLRSVTIWMIMTTTYIVVDLSMHMLSSDLGFYHHGVLREVQDSISGKSSYDGGGEESELDAEQMRDEAERICDSIEAHMDSIEGEARKPHNPWGQLKKGLPPAECRVKGHLIERLDPLNNFRRGIALGFTTDLDDKYPLENWFLGTKIDMNKANRTVYIDFGANYFTTSILWFMERYPVDFTEVYAFETDPNLFKMPTGWDEDRNWVDPGINGWQKVKSREGIVPSWLVERIHFINKFAGLDDSIENSINVTRWMKEELKLKPEDTVIVKMDIEGAEWPILYQWVKDPQMPEIIDELFVELHYWHPDNNWDYRRWSREDATRMLAELRYKGFYAHYWD